MPNPLVECIPNYSEARRPEVIDQIKKAIESVEGVYVLDQHSDQDHNRTVITFIGSPEAVVDAAYKSIELASKLINLDQHTGAHPRLGATDVVPFVPISDVTMLDCVELARKLGERVGSELNIPVYLYEEAATTPARKNLEDIRRGEYEGLKAEIETSETRKPDFGPSKLGTAGATVIGARNPLIAFNVYLSTDDVRIAQNIARAVRHSSGGMRYVKAMGILVEGKAQVSMNLTNFAKSPVARVVEMIRREAEHHGVSIARSELVGLIPQQALVDAATWYLQLDGFSPDQILEQRLFTVSQNAAQRKSEGEQEPATDIVAQLAEGTPTPGGGSAAAYTAAEAAALVQMVTRLTIGKKKYAGVEAKMWDILSQATQLTSEFRQAVVDDSQAFMKIMEAFKLPKETDEQIAARNAVIEEHTFGAAIVPLEVAGKCLNVMQLAAEVIEFGNLNAISDGGSAAFLAKAAFTAAGMNVRINLLNVADQDRARLILNDLEVLESHVKEVESAIRSILESRGGVKPF